MATLSTRLSEVVYAGTSASDPAADLNCNGPPGLLGSLRARITIACKPGLVRSTTQQRQPRKFSGARPGTQGSRPMLSTGQPLSAMVSPACQGSPFRDPKPHRPSNCGCDAGRASDNRNTSPAAEAKTVQQRQQPDSNICRQQQPHPGSHCPS